MNDKLKTILMVIGLPITLITALVLWILMKRSQQLAKLVEASDRFDRSAKYVLTTASPLTEDEANLRMTRLQERAQAQGIATVDTVPYVPPAETQAPVQVQPQPMQSYQEPTGPIIPMEQGKIPAEWTINSSFLGHPAGWEIRQVEQYRGFLIEVLFPNDGNSIIQARGVSPDGWGMPISTICCSNKVTGQWVYYESDPDYEACYQEMMKNIRSTIDGTISGFTCLKYDHLGNRYQLSYPW
jgi:hypothetical protein